MTIEGVGRVREQIDIARPEFVALLDGVPSALGAVVERYVSGEISAPVALMQLLIETEDADAVGRAVGAVVRNAIGGNIPAEVRDRVRELDALIASNAGGAQTIAAMLRADMDTSRPARTVEEGIAFSERLFDWSVQQSEEASVAMYSLGNPELLDRATSEIVSTLSAWGVIGPEAALLDVGCGIGRLLTALSPHVRSATGIDVSGEMVKAARRRCVTCANVQVVKGDGRGLAEFGDDAFDTVIAVDSFPYLRQSGYALVERFFAEIARVLSSSGDFALLNYSYSEDDAADIREVETLAAKNGFTVVAGGKRLFQIWDGLAFHLRKQ